MPRKIEKRAFLFYATTLDDLKGFPPERQGKIAMALINYGLDDYYDFGEFSGALSVLEPNERIVFRSVIHDIDVQRRRYHNKKLIEGAIETVQNKISHNPYLDEGNKKFYTGLFDVLEEKYESVKKHDSLSLPEELRALLPDDIYSPFHQRYEIKLWKDQINELLEKYLMDHEIHLPDKDKRIILDNLIKNYVETGSLSKNVQDFIDQYYDELGENK